jgi:hypothetical protein
MKTLLCKNQENPSDRISHAWAPLRWLIYEEALLECGLQRVHCTEYPTVTYNWNSYPNTIFPLSYNPLFFIDFISLYLPKRKPQNSS